MTEPTKLQPALAAFLYQSNADSAARLLAAAVHSRCNREINDAQFRSIVYRVHRWIWQQDTRKPMSATVQLAPVVTDIPDGDARSGLAARTASHADDQEHWDQAALEEQVEQHEVERREGSDHQRFQKLLIALGFASAVSIAMIVWLYMLALALWHGLRWLVWHGLRWLVS